MIKHNNIFFGIIEHTLLITTFVMVMMMLIEYVTVQTKGKWSLPIKKSPVIQIFFAAILGIIPGCLGTFAAVSLYTHKIFSFAALVTVMIATSGDDAFIMFSMMPKTALIISISIFIISIVTGLIIAFVNKNKSLMHLKENHLNFDHKEHCVCFDRKIFVKDLLQFNLIRYFLIFGGILFTLLLAYDVIGPQEWNLEKTLFFIAGIIGLLIVITVPEHFLKEHIWSHVIKKHMLKIFLWILGAFIFIHFLESFLDVESWIEDNFYYVILLAVLVGIIPASGPHIVFVTLFISGTIPFSILLANSIVQDGHGAIPLLAESKKSFFAMKGINVLVALIIGVILNSVGL